MLALSACQTAAGDDRAALGLAGIAVKAGARSAFATLWFVNDQASTALVGEFYRRLQGEAGQGRNKAQALQEAQKTLLQQEGYRHPCYWAPINHWKLAVSWLLKQLKHSSFAWLVICAAVLSALLTVRAYGLFQRLELSVYDQFVNLRVDETAKDDRIVVCGMTAEDLVKYGHPLDDAKLALLLENSWRLIRV